MSKLEILGYTEMYPNRQWCDADGNYDPPHIDNILARLPEVHRTVARLYELAGQVADFKSFTITFADGGSWRRIGDFSARSVVFTVEVEDGIIHELINYPQVMHEFTEGRSAYRDLGQPSRPYRVGGRQKTHK